MNQAASVQDAVRADYTHVLRVHSYDPGTQPQWEKIPLPSCGQGEVRVRVQASAISFFDLLLATGGYQLKLPTPFVPGSEFSGVVDAVGAGDVAGLRVGDTVCGTHLGAWAQVICVRADQVCRVASHHPAVETASLMASYATALYALRERAGLQVGDTLLVLGAAGGVGYAAVQLGRVMGARVLALASSPAKRRAVCDAGADVAFDATGAWREEIKALLGSGGVDVVFDTVGGDATDMAFRTLGWEGRHLMVGFASGQICALRSNLSIVKGASLVGVDFRQAVERRPAMSLAIKRKVVQLYEAGRIRPLIHSTLGVSEFAQAAARVRDRATLGRVVLMMPPWPATA